MAHLLALQKLQFDGGPRTAAVKAEMEKHRAEVPPPVLAHYERLTAHGKKGIAVARDGVCSECHLRFTSGKLVGLMTHQEIILCDNCGRYLYLPDTGPVALAAAIPLPPVAAKRKSKKPVPHVA